MKSHYDPKEKTLIPILQLRKLSLGKVRWLAQGPTATEEMGCRDCDFTAHVLPLPAPPAFPFTDHPCCQEPAVLTKSLFQNRLVPEYAVVNLAAPPGPRAGPKPSASPYTEIQEIRCQSQVWTQAA